jgi:hypothetical protein
VPAGVPVVVVQATRLPRRTSDGTTRSTFRLCVMRRDYPRSTERMPPVAEGYLPGEREGAAEGLPPESRERRL